MTSNTVSPDLLLATGLVHTVDGAAMVVAGDTGRRVTVGRHPSADIDPCRWRNALIAARRWSMRSVLVEVQLVGLGGSLRRSDGGLWFAAGDLDRRLLTTALVDEGDVVDALRSAELDSVPDDAVEVVVRPDPDLGVTIVAVSVAPDAAASLDQVAVGLQSALLVAELATELAVARR